MKTRRAVVPGLMALFLSGMLAPACAVSDEELGSPGDAPSKNPIPFQGEDPEKSPESKATSPQVPASDELTVVGDAPSAASTACRDVIDLVFVLDVSSSMGFVLDALGDGIDTVVRGANDLSPGAHFGLIAFVDNYLFDKTGNLEGGKVHTEAKTLRASFSSIKRTYTGPNREPGDGPQGPTYQNPICEENALDSLMAAATEFPWRPNATRVVVVATDDTFLERNDNYGDRDNDGLTDKTDFPREGDYPARGTVKEVVAALRQRQIRVFSFSRLNAPAFWSLDRCGTDRRLPWSSVSDGWSTPYKGEAPIPQQTDGRNFDLDGVKGGSVKLTDTIRDIVVSSHCQPIK